MPYRTLNNTEFGLTIGDIRSRFPDSWIPETPSESDLTALGFAHYNETVPPTATPLTRVVEIFPFQVSSNNWVQRWKVENLYEDVNSQAEFLQREKLRLCDEVQRKKKEIELGGLSIYGQHIRTDEGSQAKITGAVTYLAHDPEATYLDFEGAPNVFIQIGKEQMIAIGVAVGRHVQACFRRSRELKTAILTATSYDDLLRIDINTGWPGGNP